MIVLEQLQKKPEKTWARTGLDLRILLKPGCFQSSFASAQVPKLLRLTAVITST